MHNQSSHIYQPQQVMSDHQILERASEIIATKFVAGDAFTNAKNTQQFLSYKLAHYEQEVFAVMFLNSSHQLIEFREMFFGSISSASVYPREIVKAVLELNAGAVILSHNHPSGEVEPSHADKQITQRIVDALALIDTTVLDHIIVGKETTSFAERGLI